jgi:hypothetical protein
MESDMSASYVLGELATLKREGIITEEEYNLKKSQLLRGNKYQSIIGTNEIPQNQTIKSNQSKKSEPATKPFPDAVPLHSSKSEIVTQPLFRNWKLVGIIFGSIVLIAILLKVSGSFPLPSAVADKNLSQTSNKQIEAKAIPKEDVRNLINQWLTSWKSGDINTYRSSYAPDFRSQGKNLNAWISYKANIQKKSKNINISIDKLQISGNGNNATAVFTQSYSSSILKDSGKKKLELRKINDEWKIYREIM